MLVVLLKGMISFASRSVSAIKFSSLFHILGFDHPTESQNIHHATYTYVFEAWGRRACQLLAKVPKDSFTVVLSSCLITII